MAYKASVCIEVCVDSVESAIAATTGGATRLELCGNLAIGGGTTPSMGLLKVIKDTLPDTQIMVMIRPRMGDFIYSELDLAIMLEDIRSFKKEKITGVVFGVLSTEGTVDIMRSRLLVQAARPLQVCFHRAFDMTRNPIEAFKDVASIGGITRILTSGHGKYAPESISTLSSIASLALTLQPPITILPGSGINAKTACAIARCAWWNKFREVHLSAGQWVDGPMQFRKEDMGMGVGGASEWGIWRTDPEAVREVRQIIEDSLQL